MEIESPRAMLLEPKARVCLIGTSNAIFADGYAQVLSNSTYISSFDNYSIGGSSSNLFAYLKDKNYTQFDFVILDFCVNDSTLLDSGYQSVGNVEESLNDAICYLLSLQVMPVLFCLPLRQYENNPVPLLYRQIALRWSIPFFDVHEVLQEILLAGGIEKYALFEDPFHLNRKLSKLAAEWLIEGLIKSTRIYWSSRKKFVPYKRQQFIPIRKVVSNADSIVTRQTSLVGAEILDLFVNTGFDLSVDSHEEVVAVAVDFAHSNGSLSLSGMRNIRISLSSLDLVGDKGRLVLKVWPIPFAISGMNGRVRINVVRDVAYDVGLNHPLSEKQKSIEISVGLVGFIIANKSCENAEILHFDITDANLTNCHRNDWLKVFSDFCTNIR